MSAPADAPVLDVAVVGAHLSGLPLNGEITALGGVLVRALRTEPCYRLFCLPGGPPLRPGLLRVAPGEGHAIAVEVWGIPTGKIGALLAAIPSPLGLGTLRLEDGSMPRGFLVEPEGLRGAEDISRFGGWRAFLAERGAPIPGGSPA
jgi:allophanate hydrolase